MNESQTTRVLKSIADDIRLSVVRKLAEENCEVSSKEIVSDCSIALHVSQPTMSHHFKKLVASGVLLESKRKTEKHYRLNHPLLEECGINPNKL